VPGLRGQHYKYTEEIDVVNARRQLAIGIVTASLAVLGASAIYAQAHDKYLLKVPGGLGFADFKGYESWQTIGVSRSETAMAVILGNPQIIAAYAAGIPGNGKPFPDGSRMAKIHWAPKPSETFSGPIVHGEQLDVDFMVKDSVRFADGGGWGYAMFRFDPASGMFTPGTEKDHPPQANDAKCGVACHTVVKSRDYVFTDYATR
jgi:hypothetical protein